MLHSLSPKRHSTYAFIHNVTLPRDEARLTEAATGLYHQALEDISKRVVEGASANRKAGYDTIVQVERLSDVLRDAHYTGIKEDKTTHVPATDKRLADGTYKAIMITLNIAHTSAPVKPKA